MAATQGGALAEFGKRPLGFKVGVFAGVAAVLGLLYFQFMLRPLRKHMKTAQETNHRLLDEKDDLDAQLAKIADNVKRSSELETKLNKDREALPTEAELPAFFDMLNRKVGDAGVEVKKWEYKKELPVEDFYRVPVEIQLTGTYQQLKRFFASLLTRDDAQAAGLSTDKERIITVENLVLSDPTPKNGEIVLTATFTASTFRQDEAKKSVAAPAAGAAAGSAAPPSPPPSSGSGSGSASGGALGEVKSEVNGDMRESERRAGSPHEAEVTGSGSASGSAKLKGGL